jgi:hypothetical protein
MNCHQADNIIQESLDRALTAVERANLDMHLAGCAACAKRWAEYRALSGHAAAWVQPAVQPTVSDSDFAARVLMRIESRARAAERKVAVWPRWVAAAGCTALVAGILAAVPMYLPGTVPVSLHAGDWVPQPQAAPQAFAWLTAMLHDLPGTAARLLPDLLDRARMPAWTLAALAAAFAVNAALYLRAAAAPRGRNMAR